MRRVASLTHAKGTFYKRDKSEAAATMIVTWREFCGTVLCYLSMRWATNTKGLKQKKQKRE